MGSLISHMVTSLLTRLVLHINDKANRSLEQSLEYQERLARRLRQPPQVRGLSNPPLGVTWDPIESSSWYTCFYDQACVAAHENGESVIVFEPPDFRYGAVYDPMEELEQPSKHLAIVYDVLFGRPKNANEADFSDPSASHSRIVKRVCNLVQGICLARPGVGPLVNLTLPPLTLPTSMERSWIVPPDINEGILLTLFHRWSLQILSAMQFCHDRQVYLENFSAQQVWVHSDFSVAITGFTAASVPAPKYTYAYGDMDSPYRVSEWEHDYGKGEWTPVRENTGLSYYLCEQNASLSTDLQSGPDHTPKYFLLPPYDLIQDEPFHFANVLDPVRLSYHAKVDLFSWATFVFRLMSNCFSKQDPCISNSLELFQRAMNTSSDQKVRELAKQGHFPNIGEERLGEILNKAWKREYKSADEVMRDVRRTIETLGLGKVEGDEVQLLDGRTWDSVLEVVKGRVEDRRAYVDNVWARELRFRKIKRPTMSPG